MLLSLIGIACAVIFFLELIFSLIYIKKTGLPIWKPFGLGIACMGIGYFGAPLLLLLVNAVVEAFSGHSFIQNEGTAFSLALTTGALISCTMFFMLAKPLKTHRSAYEALTFGLGVVAPTLAYKAIGVTISNIVCIASGSDLGVSALLLLEGTLQLALAFAEAALAVLLAYSLNKCKGWSGFVAVLAAQLLLYASAGAQTAFGWSRFAGPALGIVVMAAAVVFDVQIWKRFPSPEGDAQRRRGAIGNIQWPGAEEDGR